MANRNIERAVRIALLAAGAAGTAAYAPGSLAQEQEIEQVIVTGSRIPQPNIEGTSPVTTLGSTEIKLGGTQQVESLINNLPQAMADQAGELSNGASGTATINLRNLGPNRTLVLVNGHRMPAGSPTYVPPDVNQIPASMIKRVEVLTGGASAVYGSDAVAGVVNFIMMDDFEGVQVDLNYSGYQHTNDNNFMRNLVTRANNKEGYPFNVGVGTGGGVETPQSPNSVWDGENYTLGLTMGSNFADGKGNATVFFGYSKTDPVLQSQRDYSNCALAQTTTTYYPGQTYSPFYCGGSTTSYPGRFRLQRLDNAARYSSRTIDLDTDTNVAGFPLYNFAPLNYYQRPQERYQADVFLNYDLNDQAQLYGQFMFMDNSTKAQIAPAGAFGVSTTIYCDNPYLQQSGWAAVVCPAGGLDPSTGLPLTETGRKMIFNRRNVEGGPRFDDLELTSYQGVIGVKGTWFEHWNYDVSGQFGKVIYNEAYYNDTSTRRMKNALDVVGTDPANAQCRAALNGSDPNCVPWNIWTVNPGPGVLGVGPGADYISTPGFSRGNTTQTVVTAATNADLGVYGVKMPWAQDGVGVALGVEYRQEGLDYQTDAEFQTGDLSGQGGPELPVKGSYNVTDAFFEARVPLVQDAAFAKDITFNGSYRYSDYSQGFNTNTYGLGLDWQIIDDVKLRGSFQHAVRAPNIVELFQPQQLGLWNTSSGDPCGPSETLTLEQCLNTGLDPTLYGDSALNNPAQQYNGFFGGNADLKPEEADTYTVGIVFTPTFFDGFSMTVDYWNIEVQDTLSYQLPNITVLLCGQTGEAQYCDLVHRDETGSYWSQPEGFIEAVNTNIGTTKTSGWDLNMLYTLGMDDWGSLNFNLIGTYTDDFTVQPITGSLGKQFEYNCAGYFGPTSCGNPLPDWKSKFRTTWSTPWNVDISLNWRYIGSATAEVYSKDDFLNDPKYQFPDQKQLDAQNYFDLALLYTFAEHYTINAGINNLTDEEPPLTSQQGAPYGNGNTFPAVYDALGRYMFVGISAKF